MSFIDVLLRRGFRIPPEAVSIDITSVDRMLRYRTDRKDAAILIEEAPSLTPPFPSTWMEYRLQNGAAMGLHLATHDLRHIESDARRREADSISRFIYERHAKRNVFPRALAGNGHAGVPTWVVVAHMYGMGHDYDPMDVALYVLELNEYGQILRDDSASIDLRQQAARQIGVDDTGILAITGYPQGNINIFEIPTIDGMGALGSFAMALGLLHCKNVGIDDVADTRTRQQRRYDERQNIEPVRFKTLVIQPLKEVKKAVSNAPVHRSSDRALHICRGHFATYSEDRPLFGKYAGTFWIPAHVRGTEDAGKVFKDYAIKAGGA